MIDIEIVDSDSCGYIFYRQDAKYDPEKQAKIIYLQLAMENVQAMFSELFP